MDLARCTLDNKVYSAVAFLKLPDLSTKRRHLICEECKKPAYFKKASKSGQAACFGARPHEVWCKVASEDSETIIGTLREDEIELINTGNEIQVDFNLNPQINKHTVGGENDESSSKRTGSTHSSKNGTGKTTSKRRLSSLLNMLINYPNFSTSSHKINIGHTHPYNASTIFRKFDSLNDNDIRKMKGIYGQIVDVNQIGEDNLWINSGGYNDCSIMIPNTLQEDFFNRFNEYKDDIDEFNGKYVLCFGKVQKSKNDKFYIRLDNISSIIFK